MKKFVKILFGIFIIGLILFSVLPGLLGGSSASATSGCPAGQELILLPPDNTAKCLPICEPGFKRCGEQCQNSDIYGCSTDSKPCTVERLCSNGTVCCADDKLCDPTTDQCSASCPNIICGGICCPNATDQCLNGTTCCDPTKTGKNSSGQDVCCPNELCNGVCCTGTGVECNNGKCSTKCGDKFCDPDSEVCSRAVNDGITSYFCTTKGCQWGTLSYDPENTGNSGSSDIAVCKNNQDPNKLYVAKNPSGFSGTLGRNVNTAQSAISKAQCNFNDCAARLAEDGLINASFDSDTKKCTGNFSCDIKLPALGNCPITDNNGSSCCQDLSGKFTGQICPGSQICLKGKGICACNENQSDGYLGCTSICNGHGSPLADKSGNCRCDTGYYGNNCQYSRAYCGNRGDPQNDGTCQCDSGFTGDKCQTIPSVTGIIDSSLIIKATKFANQNNVSYDGVLIYGVQGITFSTAFPGNDYTQLVSSGNEPNGWSYLLLKGVGLNSQVSFTFYVRDASRSNTTAVSVETGYCFVCAGELTIKSNIFSINNYTTLRGKYLYYQPAIVVIGMNNPT